MCFALYAPFPWLHAIEMILCWEQSNICFKLLISKVHLRLRMKLYLKPRHSGGGRGLRMLSPLPSPSCCGVVLECEWLISNTGICSCGSSESLCHLYFCCSTPHQQPGCRVNSHLMRQPRGQKYGVGVCWHTLLRTHSMDRHIEAPCMVWP